MEIRKRWQDALVSWPGHSNIEALAHSNEGTQSKFWKWHFLNRALLYMIEKGEGVWVVGPRRFD